MNFGDAINVFNRRKPDAPGARPAHLFAIVTWGAAATNWLAKVLNAHPEVLCLHNAGNPWARVTGTSRIDEMTYMEFVARVGRIYQAAGDCHAVSADSIPKLKKRWGECFRAAVVVRHPVPRILSMWNLAKRAGIDSYELDYRFLRSVAPPALDWLKTKEHLFFLHTSRMANNILKEVEVGPVFKMEALTADPNQVRTLLHHLTGSELDFHAAMLDSLFGQRLVSHSNLDHPQKPETAFTQLAEWQQDIFRAAFDPKARAIYERLGYGFKFV